MKWQKKVLERAGYKTIEDLINIQSQSECMQIKGIGWKSMQQIREQLHVLGFVFEWEREIASKNENKVIKADQNPFINLIEKLNRMIQLLKLAYGELHFEMERNEKLEQTLLEELKNGNTEIRSLTADDLQILKHIEIIEKEIQNIRFLIEDKVSGERSLD